MRPHLRTPRVILSPSISKFRLPSPLRRADKILRIILAMSEGAQIPTNRMIRLSVIEFPKIGTPRSTGSDGGNDVVDDEESPCAEAES